MSVIGPRRKTTVRRKDGTCSNLLGGPERATVAAYSSRGLGSRMGHDPEVLGGESFPEDDCRGCCQTPRGRVVADPQPLSLDPCHSGAPFLNDPGVLPFLSMVALTASGKRRII